MSPKPERLSEAVTLYEGKCEDVLPTLTGIDAVVTDPPYSITSESSSTISRSFRSVRETQFFEAWLREQLVAIVRALKDDAAIWMAIDWRGAMVLDESCARLNIREPKVAVWDKEVIGMGYLLRNTYECFAIVPMENFKRKTASEPDVWRHRVGERYSDHPSEKPVGLLRRAVNLVSNVGGIILDPYAGSGTTAVAAALEGRKCILIEKDPKYCDIIRRRIADAEATGPQSLFKSVARPALFDDVEAA